MPIRNYSQSGQDGGIPQIRFISVLSWTTGTIHHVGDGFDLLDPPSIGGKVSTTGFAIENNTIFGI
jgi:hypothetical protein